MGHLSCCDLLTNTWSTPAVVLTCNWSVPRNTPAPPLTRISTRLARASTRALVLQAMDGIVRPAHLRITGRTASDLTEQKISEFQPRPANLHLLPQLTSRIALADSLGRIHTKPRPAHVQNSHHAGALSPFMRTLSALPGVPVLTVGKNRPN